MIGCALDNHQLAAFWKILAANIAGFWGAAVLWISSGISAVERVSIDNQKIPIIETKKTERGYEIWCGDDKLREKINKEVKIEIEIVAKKAKSNNIFAVYLVYPTRGIDISFNYEKAPLKNVRVESFFAGRHPSPSIIGSKGKFIEIKVSEREWIFPTSGAIFIWDD